MLFDQLNFIHIIHDLGLAVDSYEHGTTHVGELSPPIELAALRFEYEQLLKIDHYVIPPSDVVHFLQGLTLQIEPRRDGVKPRQSLTQSGCPMGIIEILVPIGFVSRHFDAPGVAKGQTVRPGLVVAHRPSQDIQTAKPGIIPNVR